MSFFRKNPFVTLGILVLALVGLPAAIFLSQNQADDRSRAAKTVNLTFSPTSTQSSPINVAPNGTITLDLMIDPGTNAVSFLKTELSYDATKFQVDNGGFQVNKDVFPQTIQGPVYSAGKVSFSISVGADGTKAIQTPAKAGTLTLKALSTSGVSQVGYSAGTQALSISSSSTPTENVVSNTVPAYLTVSAGVTAGPTTGPGVCSNNPSNTMLVIDKSGSMSVAADVNKITQAKAAAKSYVDIIAQETRNTIGLVSYENTATVNSPLTTNYTSVKSQVDTLTAIGSTCTECGIIKANQEIAKSTSANKKVVILLTDGKANFVEGNANQVNVALAEQRALAAAAAGHNTGIVYYTIGLGQEINAPFLQQIANSTGGKYFASPTGDQLTTIYNQISQISGKGSITGSVFNDANNNKILDANEAKLSGWTLQLFSAGSTTPQTFTSDANGFNISGLCNGNYTLKEVVQPGWRQTVPVNPNEYTINIENGNSITDRNFGNDQGNTCADGIDNNNNGLIDDKDPICHTDGNPNNPGTYDPNLPEITTRCNDKIDNDNNGLIDDKDATCHTDGNADNPNSYDPKIDGERSNTCYDLKDNNGNQLIDKADPICHTDGNADNPNSYDPKLPETGGNGTGLNLTVFLHGIGNSGDNVNQTLSSLSNKNPLRRTRPVQAFIYNVNNQLISSASGQVNYSSASGNYTGRVQTSVPLPAGPYNIRVKTDRHLVRRLPGIQNIVTTADNSLPAVHLVTGDINDDNRLNILDYNILIDCYTDTLPAPSCNDQNKKTISDTDDDGKTNQTDYNLFLREIANQPGD